MSSSRRRNRRKRRGKEQFESDFDSIYRRVSDLVVREWDRLQCNVSDESLNRMKTLGDNLRKKG
jgi:hypothetical protein